MKYIIMCGGEYKKWEQPRHLTLINGIPLVQRTINQLRDNSVEDIYISSNNPIFEQFGVPVLKHENSYIANGYNNVEGYWADAFYPTDEPACYICGDVVFSPEAIKTIVETEVKDIQFFASSPPFAPEYPKPYAEPFAFKVVNQKHLRDCIAVMKEIDAKGLYRRKPIAWELWQVIIGGKINHIDYNSYVVINDYTCDIDSAEDAERYKDNL